MKLKTKIKDIAVIAMMSVVLLAVQVVLSFIPNVELVSLLIVIYTLVFGWKTIAIIYIFVILEGMVFGFGQWWFNYLYVWIILFLVVRFFNAGHSYIVCSVISGLFGMVFGGLCAVLYLFIGGPGYAFSYWIHGIPFDITHGIANIIVSLVLFKPVYTLLKRFNKRS